jgi:hypothetical protein
MPRVLFQPGQSGNPAGRKKGSKNKNDYKKQVWEVCEAVGIDPFEVLALIAAGKLEKIDGTPEKITAYLRKEAASELCQYLKPKLKAIEISSDDGKALNFYFNTAPGQENEENEEA